MTRNEFLWALEKRLVGLPQADREDRVSFYNEMIDDRMEEGLSEVEAIAELGSVDSVAYAAIASVPLGRIVRERISTKHKPSGGTIALIAIGSPIWLSLAIALLAVALSLFLSLWAVVISVWACDLVLAASLVGGVGLGSVLLFTTPSSMATMWIGLGLAAGGLSIFFFYGAKYLTIAAAKLTKLSIVGIKRLLVN